MDDGFVYNIPHASLTHPSRIPYALLQAIGKTGVLDAILFHAMECSVSRGGTKCFIPWNKVFQRLKHLKQLSYRLETMWFNDFG